MGPAVDGEATKELGGGDLHLHRCALRVEPCHGPPLAKGAVDPLWAVAQHVQGRDSGNGLLWGHGLLLCWRVQVGGQILNGGRRLDCVIASLGPCL